jgi:hypothetical protein
LCIPSGNRFRYEQINNILQQQKNEWAYKKIMTQLNTIINLYRRKKTILCGRQRGRTEQDGLLPTLPETLLPGAGDGSHGNSSVLEEGWGGTNDSFLWRRKQRR